MAENEIVTTDQTPGQSTREFTSADLALIDHLAGDDASANDTQAVTILPADDIERELKELAALRRENPNEYWKQPVQQRERELIEMRLAWEEAESTSQAVSAQIDRIIENLPEGEATGFESAFEELWDDLPENAQAIIRQELATKVDPVRPVKQASIDRFASTPEGAELVKSWRGKAGMKIAALQERMDRLTGAGEELGEWFDPLPPEQAKAVMTALAG
jgi:hypothetical protein